MMAGMGLWMLLVVVTVLAVLTVTVLAGVWLVRRLRSDRAGADRATAGGAGDVDRSEDSDEHEVLRRRDAAGEIDDGEYERQSAGPTRR